MVIPKLDNEELSSKAQKVLMSLLKQGMFDDTNMIPPEAELASSLGISRTAVRDALQH